MAGKLERRVALVTAAGSGMGRASAALFAAEGATVAVVDLSADAAAETVAGIEAAGGDAFALTCDVADDDQLRAVFAEIESRFGVLHVLYNHAGIPGPGGMDVGLDEWRHAVDVNLRGSFYATHY